MYIPPSFTVITCEPVDEEAFRAWAAANGGVWHPASESYHRAFIEWDFGPLQSMEANSKMLTEEDKAEWIPRDLLHKPPQSLFNIELHNGSLDEYNLNPTLLPSLFAQWDSYAYDLGAHKWVSALLCDLLPADRIIRYEPPPPGPPPAWVWVQGKYTKNEAYNDNLDTNKARHEDQL